jgi:signal transduction histidine kinase/ligand-binding sensor domain-containing protein/DNA-binding response OmpR family regulator
MRTFYSFVLLSIICLKPAWCQYDNIRFNHLNISYGLSSNTTNAILEDSRGFMWFGTSSGLNRFDGYRFKTFFPQANDSNSLSNGIIRCLAEDRDSNIWIGTENGLNKFDTKTEKFTRYYNSSYKNSVSSDFISDLLVDKENNLWIATNFGLNLYNPAKNLFKTFPRSDFTAGPYPAVIAKLAYDGGNNVYFLTNGGYFWHYSSITKSFQLVDKFETNLPFLKQEQLFVSKDNTIWIAFGQFVSLFYPQSVVCKRLQIRNRDFEAATDAICSDENENIWIGTTDRGLHIVNKTGTKLLQTIYQDEFNGEHSLKGAGINRLYCDRNGIIWIASNDGGISYYHKNMFRFQTFRHSNLKPQTLSDNRVNCIKQADDGKIYIGTENGLDIFNKDAGTFERVTAISRSPVLNILEDTHKTIWLTTYDGKVYKGKGRNFSQENFEQGAGSLKSVQTISTDQSGVIWLGTMGAGVFTVKNNILSGFNQYTGFTLSHDFVTQITEDSEENIWIGTLDGINRYAKNKTFKTYLTAGKTKLIHVNSIFEDSKKRIWIGFHYGLLLYDNEKDGFICFNRQNGLVNEQILGISEDNFGHLWLLTPNGLLRVSVPDTNPTDLIVKSFYASDGLPDNTFRLNSICRLASGDILVGTVNGLGVINPSSVDEYKMKPPVCLTGLRIFNKEISTGEKHNGKVVLPNSLLYSKEIELSHKESVFSIEFSALPFINPKKCKYQYRLQGFNETWITTNSDMRIATYTNLNPGKYSFCVKASADEENWGPEKRLAIIIHPPLLLSKLAKAMYVLVLIMFLFLLRYVIKMNERRRIGDLQEKADSQRLHNLDMMKINLFTNISHEFRTPLTLIISPLEKIVSENRNKELEKPLQTMQRNSQRLLHLVNQLLDFRKLETVGLDFYSSTGDIIAFTRNIVLSFNDLAEGKGIKYIFNSNIKELIMQFDYDKYDKIIYNLLSNAFKFTPEKGSIAVELNFTEEFNLHHGPHEETLLKQGELVIKVKDTGIGIPQKLQSRIFDRFVQANTLNGSYEHGSGIGLSLVYEYVRLHKGTVQVESEEGIGSCFTVRLPVIKHEPLTRGLNANNTEVFEIFSKSESDDDPEYAGYTKAQPSVLIVEDNEELRFYLKDNLKKRFRVLEADNGQAGLECASALIPDIIISDILMPVMDGIALCRKLKSEKSTSHIPVILLTAMHTDNYKLEGIEAGADDYIVKPFNFKILETRIKKILQNQKTAQQKFSAKISVEPKEITITSLDEQFIQKAFELVEKNMGNPEFTIDEFSREMAMSRMLLYKKLMALTGKAPLDFVRTMRLKRAAQLLAGSQMNISEISISVGFNDAKYFSQCFKKEFYMLPSEYQTKNATQ